MSQYKAYPAYKDSGVEWIGQVPEHWQVKRLKHLISQCQNGVWGDDPLEDGSDTLCIRVADFDRDNNVVIYNPSTYRQITKEHQDSRLVSKGDILLEKSGGGAQTLVGANVRYLGEEPAVCSNFVAVIKPSKKAESAWLNYLMASMYALKINLRSIKQSTGIQNLDSEQYLDEGVAAPSLDEQATIATALDRETARIDALIEKKTRFIELLKEKRQALITHAVTKGLDPNVNMKDSGV
ncbi:putative restriction endonuclease S subunit [Klebsiella pneumoniae]|nr:putative restriction endonuclease S subunit [Klebsiella pneumoniae]